MIQTGHMRLHTDSRVQDDRDHASTETLARKDSIALQILHGS